MTSKMILSYLNKLTEPKYLLFHPLEWKNFIFTDTKNENVFFLSPKYKHKSDHTLHRRADLLLIQLTSSPGWTVPKLPLGSKSSLTRTVKMNTTSLKSSGTYTIDLRQSLASCLTICLFWVDLLSRSTKRNMPL